MGHFAVTAIGADRPGIVAAVTAALVHAGCNLEDSSMTILRGHFAILLVLDAPAGTDATTLQSVLAAPAADLDLVVQVRPAPDEVEAETEGPTWTVTVYGADRPGIVHEVSRLLAERSVNIVDLTTRVIGGPEAPVYAMALDVTPPRGAEITDLRDALGELTISIGVDCSVHESDTDIL